jgi:hypothetical protein
VVLHVLLEVEVGKLVLLAELKELTKLVIRVNLAAILLVLEIVGADVSVNLLAHSRTGHLGAGGLAEKRGELVANASGLNKARRLTVARCAPLLGTGLLGSLKLTGNRLLKRLEIVLEVGEKTHQLLKLGAVLSHLGNEGGGDIDGGVHHLTRCGGDDRRNYRRSILGRLLGARGLCRGGSGRGGGSDGGRNRGILGNSDHFRAIYIIMWVLFKLFCDEYIFLFYKYKFVASVFIRPFRRK